MRKSLIKILLVICLVCGTAGILTACAPEKVTITLAGVEDVSSITQTTITVDKDTKYTLPDLSDERENYHFDGWSVDGVIDEDGVITVSKNVTVTAMWSKYTNVKFAYGISGVNDVEFNVWDDQVTVPEGYTNEAALYKFKYWSYNGNTYSAGDKITVAARTADFVVSAVYYDVTTFNYYNFDGSEVIATVSVIEGNEATVPADTLDAYLEANYADIVAMGYTPVYEETVGAAGVEVADVYLDFTATDEKLEENFTFTEVKEKDSETVIGYTVKALAGVTYTDLLLPKTYNNAPVVGITAGTAAASSAFGGATLNKVYVPNTYDAIANYAFYNNANLEEVVYQANCTVETIGQYAFAFSAVVNMNTSAENATGMEKIFIPASVKVISDHAFRRSQKTTSLVFAEGSVLESIGQYAFAADSASSGFKYNALTGALNLPASLVTIGNYAFQGAQFTAINFVDKADGGKLETIGNNAFQGYTWAATLETGYSRVESLRFPATVTSIGNSAFVQQPLLKSITFEKDSALKTIGTSAFGSFGALLEANETVDLVIPYSVENIGQTAFQNYGNFSSITFEKTPAGVDAAPLTIGNGAFTAYQTGAANYYTVVNTTLKSFEVPYRATSVGGSVLGRVVGLESLTFEATPAGVEPLELAIANQAFSATATTGASRTAMTGTAFAYVNKVTSLTIPARTTSVGQGAFEYWFNLETLTFDEGFNGTIGTNAFADYVKLSKINIPASMETVAAFNLNHVTTGGITATAGTNMIVDATHLEEAYTPEGQFGASLKKITIPATVKKLDLNAFQNNGYIEEIEFLEPAVQADAVPLEIGNSVFSCNASGKLNTALKEFVAPARLSSVGTSFLYLYLGLETVDFSKTSMTELPNDFIAASTSSVTPTLAAAKNGLTIKLPSSLKKIGNNFAKNRPVQDVQFAAGTVLESIGSSFLVSNGATTGNTYLGGVTDDVASLNRFTTINLPVVTGSIGGTFLTANTQLKTITAVASVGSSNSILQVGTDGALYSVSGNNKTLVAYPIGKTQGMVAKYAPETGTTAIADAVFVASNVEEVDLNGVTNVGGSQFRGSALKKLTVPESVTTWGSSVLDYAYNLEIVVWDSELTVPSNFVNSIYKYKKDAQGNLLYTDAETGETTTNDKSASGASNGNQYVSNLKMVVLTDKVTKVNNYAFNLNAGGVSYTYTRGDSDPEKWGASRTEEGTVFIVLPSTVADVYNGATKVTAGGTGDNAQSVKFSLICVTESDTVSQAYLATGLKMWNVPNSSGVVGNANYKEYTAPIFTTKTDEQYLSVYNTYKSYIEGTGSAD